MRCIAATGVFHPKPWIGNKQSQAGAPTRPAALPQGLAGAGALSCVALHNRLEPRSCMRSWICVALQGPSTEDPRPERHPVGL